MSAHIYRGSSVIRMIIRNPLWRCGDPNGIPTPPHPSLGWGSNRDPYPTPHPTPPHASIPFGDPHANPKRSSVIIPPTLPNKFIDFNNIFLNKEISRLPLYKNNNYIINIKGNPLYGPLYNLSNLKLIKLKRYLDDTLVKG